MELKKLILKNFRAHKTLTVDFSAGITGITGGNGSGKSSVVEAIMFLLTGEGYAKSKSDMISVGQTTGYVIGHMLIDGKEAILERHLDTAKVNFKYEDKVYKKSGEVNEIWDKLFQIDKNIVQNVIISNQGEIALLFNGDNSTREKLFQKIFMVPNTSKIRDVVWNNYIKTAPPEYMLKNSEELDSSLASSKEALIKNKEQLGSLFVPDEEYNQLVTRKNYLYQVAHSKQLVEMCNSEIYYLSAQIALLQISIANKQREYVDVDTTAYVREIAELDSSKPLFEQKQLAADSLNRLKAPNYTEADKAELDKLINDIASKEAEVALKKKTATDLVNKIKEYEQSGLASGVCPTCKSEVKDIATLVQHFNDELTPIVIEGRQLKDELDKLKKIKAEKQILADYYNNYVKEHSRLTQILEVYKDVSYDENKHRELNHELNKYNASKAELENLNKKLSQLEAGLNSKKIELAAAVKYDRNPEEFEQELSSVNEQLIELDTKKRLYKSVELSVALHEQKIQDTLEQIQENGELLIKNNNRKEYLDTLQAIYDIFHTSKFARMLIQTYASTVSEYMQAVLESFNFPYKAEVNEMFGIDVFNDEGLKLPSVSGGQQVMIGLSLRLALHNMFVGAFPLMIIDEGSYGLTEENTKRYFEIISDLNKNSKFKQVIVIDHNSELSEYVDHTVTL